MPEPASPRTVICTDLDGHEYEVTTDQLRWRPSAYAVIVQDGKVLISKQYGGYTIPGGGIELGELLEDGLIRETKEETGYDVGNPQLIACRSTYFKLPKSTKGVHVQSILLFYRCDIIGGEASTAFMTEEDLAGGGEPPIWMSLDKLDELPVAGSVDWRAIIKESI